MSEQESLLQDAVFEIKALRRRNELMEARLDMFDSIQAMLHTQVATKSQGMSPDIVFAIEKHLQSTKD